MLLCVLGPMCICTSDKIVYYRLLSSLIVIAISLRPGAHDGTWSHDSAIGIITFKNYAVEAHTSCMMWGRAKIRKMQYKE